MNGPLQWWFRISHLDHQNFTVILYGSAVMAAQMITDTKYFTYILKAPDG